MGGFIPSIIFCFWMNISFREFKWASRSSSFMSLAEGSEMALVTLSAVAEEKHKRNVVQKNTHTKYAGKSHDKYGLRKSKVVYLLGLPTF